VIDPRAGNRRLVLIADDDEDILQLLSFRLERAGYEIVLARNGKEALRLALDLLPAVAILDVMMPELDGFGVTRELRRNAATSTTPVILLTARAQASDITRGMAAGANDYVRKPFDARDLANRIDRLLHPSPDQVPGQAQSSHVSGPGPGTGLGTRSRDTLASD